MQYKDAIAIAKSNPGSVVKRGADGLFEVHTEDGKILSSDQHNKPTQEYPSAAPGAETEKTISELTKKIESATAELKIKANNLHAAESVIAEQSRRILSLTELLRTSQAELQGAQAELLIIKNKLASHEARISKVSKDEWDRIDREEQLKREQETILANEKRLQRNVISCACLGEVEKCPRCFGSGSYMTDGFGNIV